MLVEDVFVDRVITEETIVALVNSGSADLGIDRGLLDQVAISNVQSTAANPYRGKPRKARVKEDEQMSAIISQKLCNFFEHGGNCAISPAN